MLSIITHARFIAANTHAKGQTAAAIDAAARLAQSSATKAYERGQAMDALLVVLYGVLVLGVLVFVHEGGHYLAARAFGVRVTEFMLGLPGPNIGFTHGRTKFGVTAIPLGGYARICGMEAGGESPHLQAALASVYRRGRAEMEEVAADLGISEDDAYDALEQLSEWGSIAGPTKKDIYNTYRTPAITPTKKEREQGQVAYALGEPRELVDPAAFFEEERKQQYRSLPFWKRSVIILAGPGVNLLFAMLLFIVLFSIIGFDVTYTDTGETVHMTVSPVRAVQAGFSYIGMVVSAVVGLFNPTTFTDTVSNSASVVGIAVMAKEYAAYGVVVFGQFVAMISVSLGIMNLIPIPPLDGGRFVVEVFQKISRRLVSAKALNYMSAFGMLLFMGLFLVMINQDVQRFVFGNWS